MAIQLRPFYPADDKAELKRFIELPFALYGDDPKWVPPLRLQVLDDLDVKKNPFYRHADILLWNAYKDGRHVGRIAAIHDERHNEFHGDNLGFFGFFDAIDDPAVAEALFRAAEEWVRKRGLDAIRGPANPSFNHSVGLQVSAFDREPYVMMTQNPPYYQNLVERLGYAKAKDLYAYEMLSALSGGGFPERMMRLVERINKKQRITYRSLNMKRFPDEIQKIKDIYNSAWERNWGFVPMDDAEFDHMAKSLKDVLWPEFCLFAEIDDRPIAFSITLPDINQILQTVRNGKLLPFGIFKLLLGIRPRKGKVNRARVITMGVKSEYRSLGVASLLFYETYRRSPALGILRGEMSWILEDNMSMRSAAEMAAGGGPYKTYRVYEKLL